MVPPSLVVSGVLGAGAVIVFTFSFWFFAANEVARLVWAERGTKWIGGWN